MQAGVEKHEEDTHAGDACCELVENASHITLSSERLQKEEGKDHENKQISKVENFIRIQALSLVPVLKVKYEILQNMKCCSAACH